MRPVQRRGVRSARGGERPSRSARPGASVVPTQPRLLAAPELASVEACVRMQPHGQGLSAGRTAGVAPIAGPPPGAAGGCAAVAQPVGGPQLEPRLDRSQAALDEVLEGPEALVLPLLRLLRDADDEAQVQRRCPLLALHAAEAPQPLLARDVRLVLPGAAKVLLEAVEADEERTLLLCERLRQARELGGLAVVLHAVALQRAYPRFKPGDGSSQHTVRVVLVAALLLLQAADLCSNALLQREPRNIRAALPVAGRRRGNARGLGRPRPGTSRDTGLAEHCSVRPVAIAADGHERTLRRSYLSTDGRVRLPAGRGHGRPPCHSPSVSRPQRRMRRRAGRVPAGTAATSRA
mmetsp:Transcript_86391/g.244898  ORF Transcript_86391/g.244898 Transcript_86391/m.244898 type:complete len:350 (+) Transcript_86391:1319-2368(+)